MAGHRLVYCPSALDVASHFSLPSGMGSMRDAIRKDSEIIGAFKPPSEAVRPIWKIF
jgi:hypothetical protein